MPQPGHMSPTEASLRRAGVPVRSTPPQASSHTTNAARVGHQALRNTLPPPGVPTPPKPRKVSRPPSIQTDLSRSSHSSVDSQATHEEEELISDDSSEEERKVAAPKDPHPVHQALSKIDHSFDSLDATVAKLAQVRKQREQQKLQTEQGTAKARQEAALAEEELRRQQEAEARSRQPAVIPYTREGLLEMSGQPSALAQGLQRTVQRQKQQRDEILQRCEEAARQPPIPVTPPPTTEQADAPPPLVKLDLATLVSLAGAVLSKTHGLLGNQDRILISIPDSIQTILPDAIQNVQTVELRGGFVASEALRQLLRNSPDTLRTLDLALSPSLSKDTVSVLSRFSQLQTLKLFFLHRNAAKALPEVLAMQTQLTDLSLMHANLTSLSPTVFDHLPQLQELDLSQSDLTWELLQAAIQLLASHGSQGSPTRLYIDQCKINGQLMTDTQLEKLQQEHARLSVLIISSPDKLTHDPTVLPLDLVRLASDVVSKRDEAQHPAPAQQLPEPVPAPAPVTTTDLTRWITQARGGRGPGYTVVYDEASGAQMQIGRFPATPEQLAAFPVDPNARELSVQYLNLTNEHLVSVMGRFSHLRIADIRHCGQITGSAFTSESCEQLRILITDNPRLDFAPIVQRTRTLDTLCMPAAVLTQESARDALAHSSLHTLVLTKVGEQECMHTAPYPMSLQRLVLVDDTSSAQQQAAFDCAHLSITVERISFNQLEQTLSALKEPRPPSPEPVSPGPLHSDDETDPWTAPIPFPAGEIPPPVTINTIFEQLGIVSESIAVLDPLTNQEVQVRACPLTAEQISTLSFPPDQTELCIESVAITDEQLTQILERPHSLQALRVRNCPNLTANGVTSCETIRFVSIDRPVDCAKIVENLSFLEGLQIPAEAITEASLEEASYLKTLILTSASQEVLGKIRNVPESLQEVMVVNPKRDALLVLHVNRQIPVRPVTSQEARQHFQQRMQEVPLEPSILEPARPRTTSQASSGLYTPPSELSSNTKLLTTATPEFLNQVRKDVEIYREALDILPHCSTFAREMKIPISGILKTTNLPKLLSQCDWNQLFRMYCTELLSYGIAIEDTNAWWVTEWIDAVPDLPGAIRKNSQNLRIKQLIKLELILQGAANLRKALSYPQRWHYGIRDEHGRRWIEEGFRKGDPARSSVFFMIDPLTKEQQQEYQSVPNAYQIVSRDETIEPFTSPAMFKLEPLTQEEEENNATIKQSNRLLPDRQKKPILISLSNPHPTKNTSGQRIDGFHTLNFYSGNMTWIPTCMSEIMCPHVETLNLSRNLLTRFDPLLFTWIKRVSHIDLSYNLLSELPQLFAFSWPNWTYINLQGNRFRHKRAWWSGQYDSSFTEATGKLHPSSIFELFLTQLQDVQENLSSRIPPRVLDLQNQYPHPLTVVPREYRMWTRPNLAQVLILLGRSKC